MAKSFARKLKGSEIIGLIGDLGSGKTTFVKGLAEELKVQETITSPTFVMLKVYSAKVQGKRIDFVHIDAYRAETKEDMISAGIEDYLNRDDIIMVIEWAEKIKEILPRETKFLKFKNIGENSRKISL